MCFKKFILSVLGTLFVSIAVFSQLQFAGVNFNGTYAVNTNNVLGYLQPFTDTQFPAFYSMKQGPDGKIYFTTNNTVGTIETTGLNRTVLANFTPFTRTDICIATDGKLYVTTSNNKLYRVEPDGSGNTELATVPYCYNLAASADNWLFGISQDAPQIIFKIKTDGTNYTVLRNLVFGTDGSGFGKLTLAPNNRLYGTLQNGGPSGAGTVFKMDTSGNNFQLLYNAAVPADGSAPTGAPAYQNGKIFAATRNGGNYGGGVIVSADTNGTAATKIFEFGSPTSSIIGTYCEGGLISGGAGELFGCTTQNGKVFSIDENGGSPTVVFNPDPATIYYSDNFPLPPVLLNDGNTIFFQSPRNGFNYGGFLYSVERNGANAQLVYNHGFTPQGRYPYQGLTKDGSNNLYGVHTSGGSGGGGVVYKHAADGTGFNILKAFTGTQARYPNGKLFLATDGKLYGVCKDGSNPSNIYLGGAIYRLNTDGSGFEIIKEFNSGTSTICSPVGGFVEGASGELYGLTQGEYPSYNPTSIYKINKDGTGFSILRTLNPSTEGYGAVETLTLSGNYLYGTCINGGNSNAGTAFRIQTNGTGFQVLKQFSFGGPEGALPIAGLTLATATTNRLYGIASFGGPQGYGTLYTMNPDGSNFIVLLNFDFTAHGYISLTKLIQATDGNLYGTMENGGTNGRGSFFRYNPLTSTYTVIRHFQQGENGSQGELVQIPFSATLPVTISAFDVRKVNSNKASISWTTENEINIDRFLIERSVNGTDFIPLKMVTAAQSGSLKTKYEVIDADPAISKNYYRLKAIDKDDQFAYSAVKYADFSNKASQLSIYPNPASNSITLQSGFKGKNISITISDNAGRNIYKKIVANTNRVLINISSLPKGNYWLSADDGTEVKQAVFIKN